MTMRIRVLTTVFVWTVAAVLGINVARTVVSRVSARSSSSTQGVLAGQLPIKPYTVVFDLSPKPEANAEGRMALKLIGLRSDGSLVQQLEVLGGQNPVSSRLIKLASGSVVTTNDILERKHTLPNNPNVSAQLRDPRTRCLKTFAGNQPIPGEEFASEENVAGYRTVKIRIKGDGSLLWYATDLGCAELRSRIVHPSGDVIEQTARRIVPGEPEPSLFDVSAHYVEVPRERLGGR